MAAGFPTKANYATGDVLTAANMNDLSGTVNLINPSAKGDLFAGSAANTYTKLSVGANDTVLTADSSTSTGLKWATPASGGMTELATGTLSGTEVSLTSISGIYNELVLLVSNPVSSSATPLTMRINSYSTADQRTSYASAGSTSWGGLDTRSGLDLSGITNIGTGSTSAMAVVRIPFYATTNKKVLTSQFASTTLANTLFATHFADVSAAITSIQIRLNGTATFSSGTYKLYGVK